MKRINLLGCTGSIGKQTIEIVRANEDLEITTLACKKNIALAESFAREFKPALVAVYDLDAAKDLKTRLSDTQIRVVGGMEGLIEAACYEADIVVTAVVGMIGLLPTVHAIKEGLDIALANKETMVTAGHLITELAKKHKVKIFPVDSEHSAIFQCLNGEDARDLSQILLTASGGPFFGKSRKELEHVTAAQALKHPNWNMGPKVTIDSSTMVNKGLEVMEARWLFDVPVDQITVVVQRQSLIHSMVEFKDGAVMAQIGVPDMKLPIQYALTYPRRRNLESKRVNFHEITEINFAKPDLDTFKGLVLAYRAGRIGGSLPTVFNAANEQIVPMFLKNQVSFLEIPELIEECMDAHTLIQKPDLQQILDTEKWVKEYFRVRG